MTVGRKTLRSIRLRREAANGQRATPRYLWRGNGELIADEREIVNPEEQVGISGGTDRTYIPKLAAGLELAETEATYEQIQDLFIMAGLGTITPVQGSALGASGSAVISYLNVPTTTFPQTHSYTVEAGDNVEAQVMVYGIVGELTLSFAGGEAVKASATMMGQYGTRTNASGSFSAAGTLIQVETVLASNGTVYLDPATSGAVYGAGLVTAGNILGGEVTITAQWKPKYWADGGVLWPGTFVLTGHEITGNLIFEHQVSGTYGAAGSAGQIEKSRLQEPQLLRLNWPGGTISLGSSQEFKLLRIDLPIKWSSPVQDYGDQNGNAIVTGEFFSKYNELVPAAGRGTVTVVRRGTSEFAGA